MHISYKAHNRCTSETFLIRSDVDVNILSALRSIPSGTIDINLRSCILNRHKLRQSQLPHYRRNLWFVAICDQSRDGTNWVQWHWNVFWVLGRVPMFTFDMNIKSRILPILVLFHWFICWCVCISVIKLIILVPRKPSYKGPILMWICFLNLGVYPRLLLISIWEVVFWTVTNCDSHKLQHYRRNLWFFAICDQSRDGANWVQQHWKRVLCTWESTHVHFWHEYENLHFCPFWCYFTGISFCVYVHQL